MGEHLTFFQIQDPKRHAMTKSGFTVFESAGQLIVYCTEEGPLDRQYFPEWIEWRNQDSPKPHMPATMTH